MTAAQGEGVAAQRARDELAERPSLTAYEAQFWNDFHHLSSSRSTGMSTGQIPFPAMIIYAQHHGLTKQETDIMIRVIEAMDSTFIVEHMKRRDAKSREAAK